MKRYPFLAIIVSVLAFSFLNKLYTGQDFSSVLKMDSHIFIYSDKGIFEDQAAMYNFILITLNVDQGDSMNIRKQIENALLSVQKHPERSRHGLSCAKSAPAV